MSFFEGLFAGIEEQERLTKLAKKLGTAKVKGETECLRCGHCCHQRTCIPTPDEVIAIAAFLNMTVMDMVSEFYAIDRGNEVLYIKPVGLNIVDLAGEFIPASRTYNEGACVFLHPLSNHCRIYDARPECARLTQCWDDDSNDGHDPRKAWTDSWRDKPGMDDLWVLIQNEGIGHD